MSELKCGNTVTYSTQEYKEYKQKLKVIAKLNGWKRPADRAEKETQRWDVSCFGEVGRLYSTKTLSEKITHCVSCKYHCFLELYWW